MISRRRVDRFTLVEARVSLNHSGRRHSPAALVVEEEDEVEFLFGLVLHLLSDPEHVHGRSGNGHPVVLATDTWHVGVDDLRAAGEAKRRVTYVFLHGNRAYM